MKCFVKNSLIWICFSFYFIAVGLYRISLGFKYLEPYFISDKLQLLLFNDNKTLEIFYFTYPVISQLTSLPAALIDPVNAPLITSAISISIFATYIVVKLFNLNYRFLSIIATLYFLSSPLIVSLATSGTSLYLFLILYYIIFHFIFRYLREFTVYNFVFLSLAFTIFIFLDYSFIWITVFMLPLILLFGIFSDQKNDRTYLGLFKLLTQQKDSSKQLVGRSFSSIIVIIFTPIMGLLLYFLLNYWFTGDFYFFDNSYTTKWDKHKLLNLHFFKDTTINSLDDLHENNSLLSILYLSPIFLSAYIVGRRKILFQITMLLAPIWLLFLNTHYYYGSTYFKDLLILLAAGMAGHIHLFQTGLSSKILRSRIFKSGVVALFTLIMIGEFYYFDTSINKDQQNMIAFYKQEDPINIGTYDDMTAYIKENVPEGSRVLTDNSIFYPVTAISRATINYIDQFDETFTGALQTPEVFTDYVLATNRKTAIHKKDKLRLVIENDDEKLQLVHSNEDYSLYRVKE